MRSVLPFSIGLVLATMASAGCAMASPPASRTGARSTTGLQCPSPQARASNNLVIRPATRISVQTILDPALSRLLEYDYALTQVSYYEGRTSSPLFTWLRQRLPNPSIFGNPGQVPASNDNILIVQTLSMKANGEPYVVRLAARQGNRFWCRSIERSGLLTSHSGAGVGPEMRLPDGRIYYDPGVDIQRLTRDLISTLRVEEAELDQRNH